MIFNRQKFFSEIRPIIEVDGIGVLPSQVEAIDLLLDFIEEDQIWDDVPGTFHLEIASIRTLAYFLATVAHETTIRGKFGGKTIYFKSFEPVEEMGGNAYLNRMYDTRTDLGNTPQRDGDGAKYAGDGYVQNTGKTNARNSGIKFSGMKIYYEDIPEGKADILAAFTRLGGSQRTPIIIDRNTFVKEHELLRVPRISYMDAIDGITTGRYTGRSIFRYINAKGELNYYEARRVINGITRRNQHVPVDIARMSKLFERAIRNSLISNEITVSNNSKINDNSNYAAAAVHLPAVSEDSYTDDAEPLPYFPDEYVSEVEPEPDETIKAGVIQKTDQQNQQQNGGAIERMGTMQTGGKKTSEFLTTTIFNAVSAILTLKFALGDGTIAAIGTFLMPVLSSIVTIVYNLGRTKVKSRLISATLDELDKVASKSNQ